MKVAEARDSKGRSRRPAAGSRASRGSAASATPRKSEPKVARPKAAADGEQPIYLRIAGELKQAIADGRYPMGSRLPTELELCDQFRVSRFTAREAVRLLSNAGLVTRRQRIGTVVTALPGDARYTHDVSSIPDLFQYAQDTELRLLFIGKVALTRAMAKDFGAQAGREPADLHHAPVPQP
jgi:DNA-binding GntR family transcriptional regulator